MGALYRVANCINKEHVELLRKASDCFVQCIPAHDAFIGLGPQRNHVQIKRRPFDRLVVQCNVDVVLPRHPWTIFAHVRAIAAISQFRTDERRLRLVD